MVVVGKQRGCDHRRCDVLIQRWHQLLHPIAQLSAFCFHLLSCFDETIPRKVQSVNIKLLLLCFACLLELSCVLLEVGSVTEGEHSDCVELSAVMGEPQLRFNHLPLSDAVRLLNSV